MDWDDLEPRKRVSQAKNLEICSIDELNEYIDQMKAEIERARQMIEKKKSIKSGADTLFCSSR